jgi:hypothetical protein
VAVFEKISSNKITFDSDDNRQNYFPSIIVDRGGRRIAFYQKTLYSGRVGYARVEKSTGFLVDVEAGSGVVNNTPITWGSEQLSAPAAAFSLVYVSPDGVLHCEAVPSMTVLSSCVLLAFVSTSVSAVIRIEEIEQTGTYIFVRYQSNIGGNWVWDDREYIVNVGERPKAFYDLSNDKVILSYNKNNVGYLRSFELTDETTWEYLNNYELSINNEIRFPDIKNNSRTFFYSSKSSVFYTEQDPYSFSYYLLGYSIYIDDSSIIHHQIHVPYIEEVNYPSLEITNVYLEIYNKVGEDYVLEDQIQILDSLNNYKGSLDNWVTWNGTFGKKYLKIRFKHASRIKRVPDTYIEGYFLEFQDLYLEEGGMPTDRCQDHIKGAYFSTAKGTAGISFSYEETKELIDEVETSFFRTSGSSVSLYSYEETKELVDTEVLTSSFLTSKAVAYISTP